jgi:hypothetical protein
VTIPLTKALNLADLAYLQPELSALTPYVLEGQHHLRAWEYGMALSALWRWQQEGAEHQTVWGRTPNRILDVGGAGSGFGAKLAQTYLVETVDPLITTTLEIRSGPPADVILAISVVEHVPRAVGFLEAIERNLLPGGLAFLTSDLWGRPAGEPDTAHFHGMRERIYSVEGWRGLAEDAAHFGLHLWGGEDWAYYGDLLYDSYSFLSLALRKAG